MQTTQSTLFNAESPLFSSVNKTIMFPSVISKIEWSPSVTSPGAKIRLLSYNFLAE